MKAKFEIVILDEAEEFIATLDEATRTKIIYNMDKSRYVNDPKLFKKLTKDIWEFRTKHKNQQYRFFAFWDKSNNTETLVISTHGIIKKVSKVPKSELVKAETVMQAYFRDK